MTSFIEKNIHPTFLSWEAKEEGQDEKSFNRWANKDVIPTPAHERNYTGRGYFGFWVAAAVNTSAWTLGSSNLAAGLTAAETIGMVLVASVLTGIIAFLCGEPGIKYHVGFPMMSRAGFGIFGIQAYWGGLAVTVILASIFPTFEHMKNTLPESADITTQELIGFIIYIVVFTPLMLVHPRRFHKYLFYIFGGVLATMVGLFIWAVSANGGASVMPPSVSISSTERSFLMLRCVSSVAGAWTGSGIRQADWTRYAKTRRAAVLNQMITVPLTITITAMLGTFATSAVTNMYGQAIWQPITLLQFLLRNNYNASTRAGCFFAGLGFFLSQLSVNVVQNSVAAGMDLASLAPRWVDVTRGSLIMCLIGYVINPWRFVKAPGTFITVLNSFGMFISPLAGINVVDFWLVRSRQWKVPDLYVGDNSSIYWYFMGLNWRAFFSWTMAIWPSFPGFLVAVGGAELAGGWLKCFQLSWFIGFLGAGLIHYCVSLVFPPPGKPYVHERFGNEGGILSLDGVSDAASESEPFHDVEKANIVGSIKGSRQE
ncbi:putative permease C29B12.14c [Cladophialophora carrionii]|uniref:Putative permease C29B12.14c n=1 Tax=Cladophialophora carrionii TaxID=86049 RepID=A0A1C1C6F3_9EURO|nr:putative permease C29B12.14c [Cladophialophora carrionii]